MAQTKKVKHNPDDVVDFAFHMPITHSEQREFNAIRNLVFSDSYLSQGYRNSKQQPPIVSNRNRYC